MYRANVKEDGLASLAWAEGRPYLHVRCLPQALQAYDPRICEPQHDAASVVGGRKRARRPCGFLPHVHCLSEAAFTLGPLSVQFRKIHVSSVQTCTE